MELLKGATTAIAFFSDLHSYFAAHQIHTEGDVTFLATVIISHLGTIHTAAFGSHLKVEETPHIHDQRPSRFLGLRLGDTRHIVWEDMGWTVFLKHAQKILELADSTEGRSLTFQGVPEEHGRVMLYKVFKHTSRSFRFSFHLSSHWRCLIRSVTGACCSVEILSYSSNAFRQQIQHATVSYAPISLP
jgi:hypothetical protein